jgi:hypothetical protein
VSADTAVIFVRLSDVVGTDCDKPAVANLRLAIKFKKPFSLSAVLGAESAAAEDEHHRMLALQLGELPTFRRVTGKPAGALGVLIDELGLAINTSFTPRISPLTGE